MKITYKKAGRENRYIELFPSVMIGWKPWRFYIGWLQWYWTIEF